jgi:hypothetical protein
MRSMWCANASSSGFDRFATIHCQHRHAPRSSSTRACRSVSPGVTSFPIGSRAGRLEWRSRCSRRRP